MRRSQIIICSGCDKPFRLEPITKGIGTGHVACPTCRTLALTADEGNWRGVQIAPGMFEHYRAIHQPQPGKAAAPYQDDQVG